MGVIQNIVDEIKAISLKLEKLKKESVSSEDIKNALVERGLYSSNEEFDIPKIPYYRYILQGKTFGEFLSSEYISRIEEYKSGQWIALKPDIDYIVYSKGRKNNNEVENQVEEGVKLVAGITENLYSITILRRIGNIKLKLTSNNLSKEFTGTIDAIITDIISEDKWNVFSAVATTTDDIIEMSTLIEKTQSVNSFWLRYSLSEAMHTGMPFGLLYNETKNTINKVFIKQDTAFTGRTHSNEYLMGMNNGALNLYTEDDTKFYIYKNATGIQTGASDMRIDDGDRIILLVSINLNDSTINNVMNQLDMIPEELKRKGYTFNG